MTKEILGLPGVLPTPLHRRTYKTVHDIDLKLTHMIHKWRFLKAGPPMRVQKYDGSEICYQGIAFSGSPVSVFWNDFIDPYLENYSITVLEQTSALAIECQFPLDETIEEAKLLLLVMVRRIYDEMAETDRILRGDGINFPDKKDVSGNIQFISEVVCEHAEIEKMKKPTPANQIFNIENINGNNLQLGSYNHLTYSGIESFVKEISASNDEQAKNILVTLLENRTVSSVVGDRTPTLISLLNDE